MILVDSANADFSSVSADTVTMSPKSATRKNIRLSIRKYTANSVSNTKINVPDAIWNQKNNPREMRRIERNPTTPARVNRDRIGVIS